MKFRLAHRRHKKELEHIREKEVSTAETNAWARAQAQKRYRQIRHQFVGIDQNGPCRVCGELKNSTPHLAEQASYS